MANSESTNPQTETDLIGNFQEEALAQLLQLAEDVTLRVGKLSSEFNIDKEMIVQALGLKLPIYAHRLKKHKPTAWSEALAGMVKDAPPEVRKGSGEKQFNGSYAKWVSGNWMDRKDEFEEKAWLKDTGYRIGSERAGCRSLLDALERQVGFRCSRVSLSVIVKLTYVVRIYKARRNRNYVRCCFEKARPQYLLCIIAASSRVSDPVGYQGPWMEGLRIVYSQRACVYHDQLEGI